MKQYRLSSTGERIAGISFALLMPIVFGFLLYSLRNDWALLLFCGLGAALLTVLLGFYITSILKAECVWNPDTKKLEVKGFPSYTVDLSSAVQLQTVGKKNIQSMSRVLVFTDAQEEIVAVVPTLFTWRSGILAEPFAKEMAQDLGLAFKENIPEWQYNKEKFKEHVKEEEAQEKAASKARREAWMKKLMNPGKRK